MSPTTIRYVNMILVVQLQVGCVTDITGRIYRRNLPARTVPSSIFQVCARIPGNVGNVAAVYLESSRGRKYRKLLGLPGGTVPFTVDMHVMTCRS